VVEIIEDLNRQGMTVVMVTHDPRLGRRTVRQVQMVDGGIVSDSQEAA
jgi:putative ABC transport system ATP-binding protein